MRFLRRFPVRHVRGCPHRHARSLLSGRAFHRHAGRQENKERSDYIFRLSGISCRLVTVS